MTDSIQNFLNIDKKAHSKFSKYIEHEEAKEYDGCEYQLNNLKYIQRKAKVTPKKIGQFVTLWKRAANGVTEPYRFDDELDFVLIFCTKNDNSGYFLFPKSILIEKFIFTSSRDGKRGFRVYPPWDEPKNETAVKTKRWQIEYFSEELSLKC